MALVQLAAISPSTSVLTAMNGIPWWYFYKHGGRFEGKQLQSVDPAGRQWQFIGPQRAIG
jgi:2-dehydropantoate 2-reductase